MENKDNVIPVAGYPKKGRYYEDKEEVTKRIPSINPIVFTYICVQVQRIVKDHKYKVEQGSKYKLEHIVFCGYVCKFFGRQNLKCIKLLTNFGRININWSSCL